MSPALVSEDSARIRTEWRVRAPAPPAEVDRLMFQLGIGPAMATVIWSRGLRDDVPARLDR